MQSGRLSGAEPIRLCDGAEVVHRFYHADNRGHSGLRGHRICRLL
jgi:hypothetical protein